MSFLTQRIANRFPHWSKVRRDPSSLGQRVVSTFAETLEVVEANQFRMDWEIHLCKPWLGPGQIYTVDLEEADFFPSARGNSGGLTYTYPTVVGDALSCAQSDTFEDMIYGVPTRISAIEDFASTSYLVWDSDAPTVYTNPPDAQVLWILITDSDEWLSRTATRNPLFEGSAFIRIVGKDINDLDRTEIVNPRDDGLWRTSHFFKEISSIEFEGWTGRVRVYWSAANQEVLTDPYKTLVFDDFEAPLQYEMSTTVVDAITYSVLTYRGQRFKIGAEYRRPNVEDTESEEELTSLMLLDDAGDPFTYVDFAISDFNSFLYVLDDTGMVHVYDTTLPDFVVSQLSTEISTDAYMRVEPLNPYAVYGATEKLFTSLFRPRYPVSYAIIKRVSPTGVVRYLQGDLTWGAGSYQLVSASTLNKLGWQELTFSTEYDEMGQWEYWTTCQTTKDATVNYTAVIAGSLGAEISLDTAVVAPLSLSFDRKDQLQVGDATDVYRFQLHKDCFIPREETNQIILREDYTAVEVTY